QDGKALQAGTSHFLGQNFAKSFDVQFLNNQNQLEYVWATSWGVSTRLMGALIMTHSDDNGLVLPPKLAPLHVVIVPIAKNDEQIRLIDNAVEPIVKALKAKGITVKYDNREEYKPGWKFNEYEFKGVPVRLAIGPRDLENGTCEVCRRDTLAKSNVPLHGIEEYVSRLLDEIQSNLLERAKDYRQSWTRSVDTWDEFKAEIEKGGFLLCHWDGTTETEEAIKTETKATIRCIPLDAPAEEGKCIFSGQPSHRRVVFARAY
ncbi:MAG: His/Gly/Thr/Pro-type tRNA ligase C-terminal domain-containing protein, partial [Bacteroidales bacterium]|nr:His/Gly/Thr/Pro-type tRNA ligase C-terminal domain-containing protein [Bacteroidales bacterium]